MASYKDLISIEEVRELVQQAYEAVQEFKAFNQERVDKIVKAMAEAAYEASEKLAKMAHEETGFGKIEDKIKKNQFASMRVWESIKDLKTVGVINQDKEKKIIEIGEPMGVVAALIPSTNPTSTMIFKTLISIKGRNAIVASPHPKSVLCTLEATKILREAADAAGAPKGLIHCMSNPTIEGTNELMKHKLTAVILATGSSAMVKAAYSSGKPAYGVGPGNVPAFIERTANIRKAVADILSGKQFDNGVLCSTESALVCDAPIKEQVVAECKRLGGYFVEGEDKQKLARLMFTPKGELNPAVVGKSAVFIAEQAGIKVPSDTKVLIAELAKVGPDEPLSHEKLSPVLSFYTEMNWRDACHRCIELLEFGGLGHTMVIHSRDEDIIMKFAMEKPASRILVNTQSALGAIGGTNELLPSLTLGPGTLGGSIISENVSAKHLINIKRLVFETRPVNKIDDASPVFIETQKSLTPDQKEKPTRSWIEEIEARLREGAGNIPVWKKPQEQPDKSESSQRILGSGITEEEVERIIREFSKR
ncbi:MAG: Acetaldehyde dehydrogenase, ethanolamine utilization cluster [Ignavibacteriae bacterium]|nr:MAG: Acetaldehyde dehydrogenase, ethanolamine utilization cluster [Ignavibacteriota bacterium]